MSKHTGIEWCDSTGGPWMICSEVSPGCAHCYAKHLATTRLQKILRRSFMKAGFKDYKTMPLWGDKVPRVMTKSFWADVITANRNPWICRGCGKSMGQRRPKSDEDREGYCDQCRVMTQWRRVSIFPSMIDWLDEMPAGAIDQTGQKIDPFELLARFLGRVYKCQNIHWLLLTKRPENWETSLAEAICHYKAVNLDGFRDWMVKWATGTPPANVAIGVSVEKRDQLERLVDLCRIPAVYRFVSFEPLLENIGDPGLLGTIPKSARLGYKPIYEFLNHAIIGGESGDDARPCYVEWIHQLGRYCLDAGLKLFNKQLGSYACTGNANLFEWPGNTRFVEGPKSDTGFAAARIKTEHTKGGDPKEWPEDLRVQEQLDWI